MKYVLLAFIAGTVSGIGSIILKFILGGQEIIALFINPMFILSVLMGTAGFFISQISMRKEKSSHVNLASTSSTNIIVILGSYFFLKEVISLTQFIGIILVITSAIIIIYKS